MPLETIPFDPAEFLDAEGQAELVTDALSSGDGDLIRHALHVVARARRLSHADGGHGMSPEVLEEALGPDGDPRLSAFLVILAALGLRLSATAEAPVASA